jgi:hypothetical protein
MHSVLVLPTGGMGIGVEANGSNFPFVQPSDDITGLLADLWLAHEVHTVVPPLRVSRMVGFQQAFDGLPSAANLTIVDAADATIFDSPGATYSWKDWGTRFRIHEWLFPDRVCRVVQHCATADPAPPWPQEIVPTNGLLDERASELLAQRLLRIQVGDNTVTGEVTFINGWNVGIAVAPYKESLRTTTSLTYSANPGDGPGRYPGCQSPDAVIRTINGQGPDTRGNFTLAAGDCYYVRQPLGTGTSGLAVPVPSTLVMGNDCGPCCDCNDFVNVQRAILNIESGLRSSAAIAENTRDEYVEASVRWNESKACYESQLVKILAVTSARTYADVNITICNGTPDCLVDIRLSFIPSTSPTSGPWSIAPGTTFISQPAKTTMAPYQLTSDGKALHAFFDAVNPMASGRLKTRLAWNQQMPTGTMLTITATAMAIPVAVTGPTFPQTATYTMLMT